MKQLSILLATAILGGPLAAWAEDPPAEPAEERPAPAAGARPAAAGDAEEAPPVQIAATPVLFSLPNRGAPITRFGGATRGGGGDALPRIEALVPEESGWTLEAQPVLYWYLSEPTDAAVELVVLELASGELVLETPLLRPQRAGIQRLALADHGVRLAHGTAYQWLVKLVPDPEQRSHDRIAGGGIERVAADPELAAGLAAPGASTPHLLAEAGIWYDALDQLSRAIQAEPDDPARWNQRAALLAQVGLPRFDRGAGDAEGFERRP